MLRLEVRNARTPIEAKPPWLKTRMKMGPATWPCAIASTMRTCTRCVRKPVAPNIFECSEDREATFLIGGDHCTRRCDFCQIDTGKPAPMDHDERRRVAESVATMGVRYATVTGVARDDVPDGGTCLYAGTVRRIHQRCCTYTASKILVRQRHAHDRAGKGPQAMVIQGDTATPQPGN